MSHPTTQGIFHIDPDLLAFQKYVSSKTAISSRPVNTANCLWARYLQTLIKPPKEAKRAPSNFAKFNDGFGESGVTLAEAIRGIREFIRAKDSEGNDK